MTVPAEASSKLRAERDRFVAFAFASADVLFEIDSEGAIRYVTGAAEAHLGLRSEGLMGSSFFEMFSAADQRRIRAGLAKISPSRRMPRTIVTLLRPKGDPLLVALTGYRLSDDGNASYLAFSVETQPVTANPDPEPVRDEKTGLLDKQSFGEIAEARIREAQATGDDYKLTMLGIGEIEQLRDRIEERAADDLMSGVGEMLREFALDGDLAGQFDDGQFGVIHDASVDVADVKEKISTITREADPSGVGVEVSEASVNIDANAFDSKDGAKAVLYTINKFSECKGKDFTIDSLSDGYKSMVKETVEEMSRFKTMISEGGLRLALQPIVDLGSRKTHHYECLVRFPDQGDGVSPFERITFAEEVGVISALDYSVVRRAIDVIARTKERTRQTLSLAVNLSVRSLEDQDFIKTLIAIFKKRPEYRKSIAFEVTESAHSKDLYALNDVIQTLRKAGHAVFLDDFGAGAAAFHYLRAIDVDVVKIDGMYVREALSSPTGKPFLKAMAGLCHDLNIGAVAEMVEDENTVTFLKECAVQFGQGYLFGKPSLEFDPMGQGGGANNSSRKEPVAIAATA